MAGILTLGALGLGLSVDAFAAAIGKGASGKSNTMRDALRVGAVFGFFEAITPAFGWAVGLLFAGWISRFDHWVAFALLAGVGGHMFVQAMWLHDQEADAEAADAAAEPARHGLLGLALTALATSIDATAVGVSLAVLGVNILSACLVIGAVTTVVATIGVLIGRKAGVWLGRYAEVIGGVALIAIGGVILYQHLSGQA